MGQVENTLEQILGGGTSASDVADLLRALSPNETLLLHDIAERIHRGEFGVGDDELDNLWKVDYTRRPPTVEEFVTDDYWMGSVLRPSENSQGLFPEWKRVLCQDFDLDSRVHNVVLTGSLGTGKTFIGIAIFLYRLTCATLLRDPQHFFGLSKGSAIVYAVLSVTKRAVTETAMGDAMNFLANSPYFSDIGYNPDLKYSDGRIMFPNRISLTAGSKGQHIIGRNAMGVMLDEGNWRLESNPDERAYKLYDEIRTRITNRFQKTAGFLPAISILASSARDESSFTEKVIKEIDESKDPNQKIYRYAVYQIKRPLLKLKGRWFKVAYGLKSMDPHVLQGWYLEDGTPTGDTPHEEPPQGAKVELVPEDYHAAFKRDCVTNLQSLSGISAGGSHRFLPSIVDLERCVELAERSGVVNPAKIELIPISNEDNKNVWDYLNHRTFLTRRLSRIEPLRHPEQLRFAHVDLATTTMAGVAVCHLVGNQLVENLVDRMTGKVFSDYRLVVEYDFILTIVAGRQKPISIEKIQNFFFWLRDICHYRFGKVTADQFQSTNTLQMMEARGFETGLQSLDRTKAPYYAWKTAIEELRIRPYRSQQLMYESEHLLDLADKVDHPPDKTKDTTDGACGAYNNAIAHAAKGSAALPAATSGSPAIYANQDVVSQAWRPPVEVIVKLPPQPTPEFFA